MKAKEVVLKNQEYLKRATHYSSTSEIHALFARYFLDVKFVEPVMLRHHRLPIIRLIARYLLWMPPMAWLYRTFRIVAVMTVK